MMITQAAMRCFRKMKSAHPTQCMPLRDRMPGDNNTAPVLSRSPDSETENFHHAERRPLGFLDLPTELRNLVYEKRKRRQRVNAYFASMRRACS